MSYPEDGGVEVTPDPCPRPCTCPTCLLRAFLGEAISPENLAKLRRDLRSTRKKPPP